MSAAGRPAPDGVAPRPGRRPLEAALLVAAVATPLAPGWTAPAALLALAAAWILLLRPLRREVLLTGTALLVALAALGVRAVADRPADPGDAEWREATRRRYAALWSELAEEAARASEALPDRARAAAEPVEAFRALAAIVGDGGEGRGALLLVDPDGTPVAWAGEGLLHELTADAIPRAGADFRAGFAAVTALVVEPMSAERRPWRVVAARSFATDHLPFAPGGGRGPRLRWSLIGGPADAAPGTVVLPVPDAPDLVLSEVAPAAEPSWAAERAGEVAWFALAFALFALAVTRGLALALPGEEAPAAAPPTAGGRIAAVFALGVAAAVAAGLGAGARPAALAMLPLAGALAVGGLGLARSGRRLPRRAGETPLLAAAGGAAAVLATAGAAALLQAVVGVQEAGPALFGDATTFLLRLALAVAAAGLVALAGAAAGSPVAAPATPGAGERWAWGAAALLVAGAAACDFPWLALPLLAGGGAAAAVWAAGRSFRRAAAAAVLALLAAAASAGAWEALSRHRLRHELATEIVARVGPPVGGELAALERTIAVRFAAADLAGFLPRSPEGIERQDLAFLLWQASPLAHPYALSSLVVRPLAGPPSTFGFGLPLAEDGTADWGPLRWQDVVAAASRDRLLEGSAVLSHRGAPWARVEWTLLPLPGYRLRPAAAVEEIEIALLKGAPGDSSLPGLPPSVELAVYDADGRSVASPWQEAPPLPPRLAGPGQVAARTSTPTGPAWAVARPLDGSRAVLFLPLLSPLGGLERGGSHVLGVLLVVLVVVGAALLVALPRAAFRELLRRTVRSYSKRLLIVYTLLLLVPLLLLNTVLVAGMGDRLRREQRAAGERALSAAQRVLGDYLESLEPGFDLASELDDTLLMWLSQVVRHEINLYWGSEIWASTKPELFAARLLPKRIPGESYARLALLGYDLASRTNRVGDASYLELYAPLRLPGEEVGPRNFFLSMPLLAQQAEVARELAALRRQALLVTAALVVLVTAVGVRLSRSFTRPLTDLVAGTRRIAAGAPSLDLAPTELELAALVEAVDEMARRIAEGRQRLVREKQVVERIIEHITAGVVSLDRERRVLMRNRVAAELLGVEVGQTIADAVAGRPRLAPVEAWLATVPGGELAQRTLRLATPAVTGTQDGAAGAAGEREWTLVWVPVPGSGDPAALLVVEDATETLRGQRLEAWAEMARIIAHEIKNPLTPIRLNVEHMQQVWNDQQPAAGAASGRFGEVLERCTGNVLAQVRELQQIAAEFSTYSRIPRIDPRPGDLVAAMRELVEPYREAPPPGVVVELEAVSAALPARFDRRLLARAVRNLLENALRASAGGGRVLLRVERREAAAADGDGGVAAGAEARIAVLDSGPGIDATLLPRIFDPYFSTHDTGTGLGLPIARRIAEEHGGAIAARNRGEGGLEVVITLPL